MAEGNSKPHCLALHDPTVQPEGDSDGTAFSGQGEPGQERGDTSSSFRVVGAGGIGGQAWSIMERGRQACLQTRLTALFWGSHPPQPPLTSSLSLPVRVARRLPPQQD